MDDSLAPSIAALYRYPVKGLGPQPLEAVALTAGETLPLDRAYAIENGGGHFDPAAPKHFPKTHFLMLMRNARLAALDTDFDSSTHILTLRRDGKQVARGALSTALGRQTIERFMAAYLAPELRGSPRLVTAPGHSFTDKAEKLVHIVGLATVRELERAFARRLDPLRFRANLYVEADRAWEEFEWLEREIAIGEARLSVVARTGRCAATDVEPATGVRADSLPAALMRAYGHKEVGVYARVRKGGRIAIDDRVHPAEPV